MLTDTKALLALIAPLFVGACAGTSVPLPSNQLPIAQTDFEAIETAHYNLETASSNLGVVPFSYSIAPGTNNYLYQGFVALDSSTPNPSSHQHRLVGSMKIDLTFDTTTATLSGEISNIVDSDDNIHEGILNFSSAQVFPDVDVLEERSLTATFEGLLAMTSGEQVTITGGLEGDFRTADFQLITGHTSLLFQTSSAVNSYSGSFVVSR